MRSIPGDLSTDLQPPLRIPLVHFVVALCFLLAGSVVGLILTGTGAAISIRLASVHLLLIGWVSLTILGAMTQFVPVWSGVRLHSHQLATIQLPLVGVGLLGLAGGFGVGDFDVLVGGALLVFVGFGVFVYNIGRTLWSARPWDVTETHFALGVGFFLLAVAVGTTLALDFRFRVYPVGSIIRTNVISAHVTLAVFGGVLATIVGALYQLAPMFTQARDSRTDRRIRRVESGVFPVSVLGLAVGRLFDVTILAALSGLGVGIAVLLIALFVSRQLYAATVQYSPMLPRYAIAAVLGIVWSISAGYAWILDPVSPTTRFGFGETGPILLFGMIGFVIVGTLYHVIPFLIWVHRYSHRVGFEPVPMIDDLYDPRLERFDLAITTLGTGLVFLGELVWPQISAVGTALVVTGVFIFVTNMARTVTTHAPDVFARSSNGADTADE